MEQPNKFPFRIIEGGKKEKIEKIGELAREAIGFISAYKNFVEKYSEKSAELAGNVVELENLIIFIKAELSQKGISATGDNLKEFSDEDMDDMQLITPVHSFLDKIEYEPSFENMVARLKKFMTIRKYSLDKIFQIKMGNLEE